MPRTWGAEVNQGTKKGPGMKKYVGWSTGAEEESVLLLHWRYFYTEGHIRAGNTFILNIFCCFLFTSVMSDSVWAYGLQPPGSSVHGIFQARILKLIAISFSVLTSGEKEKRFFSREVSQEFSTWTNSLKIFKKEYFSFTISEIIQRSPKFLSLLCG